MPPDTVAIGKVHNAPAGRVAIVDYGLGNLYSVQQACAQVDLHAEITSSKINILEADAVILPGVGAFQNAMATLHDLDLVGPLRDIAASPKPLIGICLGIQLLMSESYEFGWHQGLGIIEGTVIRFDNPTEDGRVLKVPQIGWNRIHGAAPGEDPQEPQWADSLLQGLHEGEYMYFVHSYIVQPQDPDVILSISRYGDVEFCSSLRCRNVSACQFHPERSGRSGIEVYHNIARIISRSMLGAC